MEKYRFDGNRLEASMGNQYRESSTLPDCLRPLLVSKSGLVRDDSDFVTSFKFFDLR